MRAPANVTDRSWLAFKHPGRRSPRSGSILVEFGLIALVLTLLMAATVEFGRALMGAQLLQQAADTAAREVARTPNLPAAGTLTDWSDPNNSNAAFNTPAVKQTIFDEQYLVVSPIPENGLDFFNDKPILNRLLAPLMIRDTANDRLQYPGALVSRGDLPSGFTVKIPVVSYAGGVETISGTMMPVLQEILPNASIDPGSSYSPDDSPYNLLAANVPPASRGMVALRINYPFQAATLSATAPNSSWPPDPNFNFIEVPTDEAGGPVGTYAGQDGLGHQLAFGRSVRPFRRLISAQAIYRREIFGP